MSLNFGSIFGALDLDLSKWQKSLDRAYQQGDRTAARSVQSWRKAGVESGDRFADGVEKKTSGLAATIGKLVEKAAPMFGRDGTRAGGTFADGVQGEVVGLKSSFSTEGRKAGEAFTDGAKRGADGEKVAGEVVKQLRAERGRFAAAGRESGEAFSDGAERGASGLGPQLGSVIASAKAGLVTAAAAIGVAVGAALLDGMEMDRVTDKMTAALGVGGPRAGQLGRIAGQLYADNFGDSIDQVADAMTAAFRNGLLPTFANDQTIKRVTGDLLTFATVLDQDVGMSAQAVGQMLRTGLARDAKHAFDILTRGIQMGADKAGDLMETMQEYSTQFRALGLSGEQAITLLSQAVNAGARDADTAADALKEFAIRGRESLYTVTKTADTSAQALDRVKGATRSLASAENDHLRTIKAANDARTDQLKLMRDLAEQADDGALSVEDAAIGLARAQERLAEVYADPASSALDTREAENAVRRAQDALEDEKAQLVEVTAARDKANTEGVDGAESVMNANLRVLESQRDMQDATEELARARAELADSYAKEIRTLTPIGQAYRDLGLDGEDIQRRLAQGGDAAASAFIDVMNALNGVEDPLERNLIAVSLLGTKAEDLQGAYGSWDLSKTEAAMAGAAGGLDRLNSAFDNASSEAERGKRRISGAINDIANEFTDLFQPGRFFDPENFKLGWKEITGRELEDTGHIMSTGWTTITAFLDETWETMKTGWAEVTAWFGRMWDDLGLDSLFGGTWNFIKNILSGALNILTGLWNTFSGMFSGDWSKMWEGIKRVFSGVWLVITDIWGRLWNGMKETVGGALGAIWTGITWTFDTIVGWLGGLKDRITDAVSGAWDGLKDAFRSAINWIIDSWNEFGFTFPTIDVPVLGEIGGWKFATPDIPRFHSGVDRVPGRPGQEVPAILEGGERVRTAAQAANDDMWRAVGMAAVNQLAAAGRGAGTSAGPTIINNNVTVPVAFHGPVAGRDAERWIDHTIREATRKGVMAIPPSAIAGKAVTHMDRRR